jgi:hypothetical protein
MKLLTAISNKHAPIKNMTKLKSPWIDEVLENVMVESDEAKGMANKSDCTNERQMYYTLRHDYTE